MSSCFFYWLIWIIVAWILVFEGFGIIIFIKGECYMGVLGSILFGFIEGFYYYCYYNSEFALLLYLAFLICKDTMPSSEPPVKVFGKGNLVEVSSFLLGLSD